MSAYSVACVQDRTPPRYGPIFISHASADRGHVEPLIACLEARGVKCWVSYRDVGLGDNYQEAIATAIAATPVLIVVISRQANSSIEIPKELSLASRHRLVVMPLRVEPLQLNPALAYELSTHRWIDLFDDWNAGCGRLLRQLAAILPLAAGSPTPRPSLRPPQPAPKLLAAPAVNTGPRIAAERSSPMIEAVKFVFVAVSFALPLYAAVRDGGPSLLGLCFSALLVIGCARLVGALLGGVVAVSEPNRRRQRPADPVRAARPLAAGVR